MKKIALCFLISYEHILNKEEIWREWIKPNKDIINIYFHYTNYEKIKSEWIKSHALPANFIASTSYFHVVPAYMSTLFYAIKTDSNNQWFCFLTESCVPIISPENFRNNFLKYQNQTIMKWKPAWWNVYLSKRANLVKLPNEYHLGNDPWFILCKQDAIICNHFALSQTKLFNIICAGGLANESIFIIMLHKYTRSNEIINKVTHAADWERMSSSTSPYVFKEATNENIKWIEQAIKKCPETMFLRKVSPSFPNEIIEKFCKSTKKSWDSYLYPNIIWICCFLLLLLALPSGTTINASYKGCHGLIC